ncbi:MAG: hypothetical protein ABFD04_15425 [Syntrophomonas sp.]
MFDPLIRLKTTVGKNEDTSVKGLDEMYRKVIAFVVDEFLERIDRVDFRIKT